MTTTADSTIVVAEGTFEEHVRELVNYLARGLAEDARPAYFRPFQESFEGTDAEGSAGDERKRKSLILVLGAIKSLGEGTDREIDGFFNLLYYRVLSLFTEPEALKVQLTPLIHTITDSPDHTAVKYRVLSNLFNALPRTSPLRLQVYNALLTVASSQDDVDVLSIRASEVEQWLKEWQIPQEEKSGLLKRISEAFAKSNQLSKSYEYLQMCTKSLPSSSSEATPATLDTIALALRLPSVFDFDSVLRLDSIKTVKDHPLLSLVRTLLGGSFTDFEKWMSSNDSVLGQFKLDKIALERKMRLLTLAGLGTQSVGSMIPYSNIASALHIDVKDVETWVIDGMRANLIGGKLSQPSQTLHVTRATYQAFKPTDWKYLQERLVSWKSELLGVLDVVAAARQAKPPAPGNSHHKSKQQVNAGGGGGSGVEADQVAAAA
ncbi:hypothetical protein FRB94_011090 [Tulasnella sp. JGI-2019a]|nr:hypothetical protein FRB94_011090 [Tulasnella sp. JGI-2019a]KAG8998867.1 hypothetical protein FRB93_013434 [Tulasnella sp. JGI-2019a]